MGVSYRLTPETGEALLGEFAEEADDLRTGGVPVRSPEDYRALYAASQRGNYPLLRTYSGTDDFVRLAKVYVETINIAWCAIPLFWFNLMDGRGPPVCSRPGGGACGRARRLRGG